MTGSSLAKFASVVLAIVLAAPLGAAVPEGFSEVVLFAKDKIELKDGVEIVSGDVVVNQIDEDCDSGSDDSDSSDSDSDSGGDSDSRGRLKIGKAATTAAGWELKANSVKIKQDSVIGGDVFYNALDNQGAILGAEVTPLALPVFATLPPFETAAPGTDDVEVGKGETIVLPPGSYGELDVDDGGGVIFSGGVYVFREVKVDKNADLLFEASSQVLVEDDVETKDGVAIGPADGSGIDASEIIFYVAGTGNAFKLGKDNVILANVYAPNGKIELKDGVDATGAFVGCKIKVGKGGRVALSSFFNEPPEPQDDSATVDEGGATSVLDSGETSVLANDSDPNNDPLTVTATPVDAPDHGTLTLNADGTFTYSHDGSETVADSFVYEVCDDGTPVECATATVAITINPVNDPPVAEDDSATTDEDVAVVIAVLANDSDVDGNLDPSSLVITSAPTIGTTGVDFITGEVTYTPNENQSGEDSFEYQVCDDGTPLPSLCDTATVSVTVNAVNDAPVADPQSVLTENDTPIVITLTGSDVDGDSLVFSVASGPAQGSLSGITPISATSAQVTYTPDGVFVGLDPFDFQVDDGNGGTDVATVTVTVEEANEPPTADPQSVRTDEAASITITLTGSDPDGDPLTFSIVSVATKGLVSNLTQVTPTSATVVYTPFDPTLDAEDAFDFRVTDDQGETDDATVRINPEGEVDNNPPAADSQSVTTSGAAPIGLTLTASDPDAGDTLTIAIIAAPTAGVLSGLTQVPPTSATVTYTPNTADDVEDQFTFEACDDGTPVLCDSATVFINVDLETDNDPPTAIADRINVERGGTATTLASGSTSLLANDSDINGDGLILTTTPVSGPSNGTVTLFANGTFSYTHNGSATASDSFVYEVCDDGTPQECATATVAIRVLSSITLTIEKAGDGDGLVTSTPAGITCGATCSATFTSAQQIFLQAVPDEGSTFQGWSGDSDCNDGIVTPDVDKTCVATFGIAEDPPTETVTITVQKAGDGGGLVTSSPAGISCGATCSAAFTVLQRVDLIATADEGSVFAGWSGNGDCLDGQVSADADKTCVATFNLEEPPGETFTLTIVKQGTGDGSISSNPAGINCGPACSVAFDAGEVIMLLARPEGGAVFSGYGGDPDCADGQITLVADTTCTATFDFPN